MTPLAQSAVVGSPAAQVLVRPALPQDDLAVIALWRACELLRPWNDPVRDLQRKRSVDPSGLLVAVDGEGCVIGTVMAGYDGHRGWINYLGVHPAQRRRGVGRQLLEAAESRLRARGCPKINLQVRSDNGVVLAFYARLGYAEEPVRSCGKRLMHDLPPEAADCQHT